MSTPFGPGGYRSLSQQRRINEQRERYTAASTPAPSTPPPIITHAEQPDAALRHAVQDLIAEHGETITPRALALLRMILEPSGDDQEFIDPLESRG